MSHNLKKPFYFTVNRYSKKINRIKLGLHVFCALLVIWETIWIKNQIVSINWEQIY